MRLFDSVCPWLREIFETMAASAAEERLGHGWLITGPEGIGKRNLVYLIAERLVDPVGSEVSLTDASPQGVLESYSALEKSEDLHPDLHRVRPLEDKLSISIEQIREITAALGLTPHLAGRKVVVIEQAEAMTTAAANALLKSLEEPTPNTYLFLIASQPGKLPATIRSRCQRLSVKPPSRAAVAAWLGLTAPRAADIPPELLNASPLVAALAIQDEEFISEYSEIIDNINLIYRGKADPLAVAEAWQKQGAERALGYLINSLRSRIRGRLVPDRSTPITDSNRQFVDNADTRSSTDALFQGLEIAENLREQIGRGVNVELALKALLLELAPTEPNGVKS